MNNELPEDFDAEIPVYEAGKSVATRSSSGDAINALRKNTIILWWLVLTLLVQTKQQLKVVATSLQKHQKVVIFGLVYVNLQWVLH